MATVAVVGDGPATTALVAALESAAAGETDGAESDLTIEQPAEPEFGDANVGVVVDRVGAGAFEAANAAAEGPWLAVELGGVGGYPVVDASIAGFHPDRSCYACLQGRVAANVPEDADPVGHPSPTAQHVAGAIAADAALDLVADGADASPVGHVTQLPYADREFLPLPRCECAGTQGHTPRRGVRDVGLEGALRAAERALDDRLGVVADVSEVESYPTPYYLATLCETEGFSDASAPRQAAGVASGWNEALMKGLGESLERYAAAIYDESDTVTAPASELDAPIAPTDFVTPEWAEWSPDEEIEWVPAIHLDTEATVHVPAAYVFHPPRHRRFRPATTTGLAVQTAPTPALAAGLSEVIERDATMLSWYSTFEPLGLAVEDEEFRTLAARARSEDLTVTPLLLTQDVDVPVVGVAVHREEWPRFALGSAAGLDPGRAARNALAEAIQNWIELRGMGPEGAGEASGAIGQHAELPDADRRLLDPDETVPASSVGPAEPPTGEAELDALIERTVDAGLDPYAVRTTPRDLGGLGFEAVRVLVPSAQPLFLGEAFFGDRAESVPADLGFEPRLDRQHHPFP